MLALPLKVAVGNGCEAVMLRFTESDVIEFPLTWYTCTTPASNRRMIVLMFPCRFLPLLLYFTLKPKLFLVPGSPAFSPAESDNVRKPPPVMKLFSGLATSITVLSLDEFRV